MLSAPAQKQVTRQKVRGAHFFSLYPSRQFLWFWILNVKKHFKPDIGPYVIYLNANKLSFIFSDENMQIKPKMKRKRRKKCVQKTYTIYKIREQYRA